MRILIWIAALCSAILIGIIILFFGTNFIKLSEVKKLEPFKEPFDIKISTEKLPPNFIGANIDNLFQELSKKQPRKRDEFETLDDYYKRSDFLIEQMVNNQNIYFLQFTKGDDSLSNPKYDVDKEVFKFAINLSTSIIPNEIMSELRFAEKTIHIGDYTAHNAFGANILVKQEKKISYHLFIINEHEIVKTIDIYNKYQQHKKGQIIKSSEFYSYLSKNDLLHGIIDVEIPVNREKARECNIRVLAIIQPEIYKMKDGYYYLVNSNSHQLKPEFNSPYDIQFESNYLFAKLLGIWVYDFKSGEILKKFMPAKFLAKKKTDAWFSREKPSTITIDEITYDVKEIANTKMGKLSIVEKDKDGNWLILFNNSIIKENCWGIHLTKTLKTFSADVFIINESRGGNQCNGRYRFIIVKNDGQVTVSNHFGNCMPAIIKQSGDRITVDFVAIDKQIKKVYATYDNGVVTIQGMTKEIERYLQ